MFQILRNVSRTSAFCDRRIQYLTAAAFFCFLLTLITLLNFGVPVPLVREARIIPSVDKFAHVFMYGILALLVNVANGFAHFKSRTWKIDLPILQLGSLAVLLFSLTEEWSQQFFESRTCDPGDAVCNLVGVALFTWVSLRITQRDLWHWLPTTFLNKRRTLGSSRRGGT